MKRRAIRIRASRLAKLISEVKRLSENDVIDFKAAKLRQDIKRAQQQPTLLPRTAHTSPNVQFVVRFEGRSPEMMRGWIRNEIEGTEKPTGDLWRLGMASHSGSVAVVLPGDEPGSLRLGLRIEPGNPGWELPSAAMLEAEEEMLGWLQSIVGRAGTVELFV